MTRSLKLLDNMRMMVGEAVIAGIRKDPDIWADVSNHSGEHWPELLQVLFVASQSQDAGQREVAFRVFTTTPGIIEKQHEETVLGAFTKGFEDTDVIVCW